VLLCTLGSGSTRLQDSTGRPLQDRTTSTAMASSTASWCRAQLCSTWLQCWCVAGGRIPQYCWLLVL
jgi:hypothetical protein